MPWCDNVSELHHGIAGGRRDMNDRRAESRSDVFERQQVINDFSDVIDIISRSMVQVLSRELAQENLTVLQFHALRAISTFGPEMDMSSIGAITGLPPSSLTSIFDRLDEHGLVERRHNAQDRRRVVAALTPQGVSLMKRIRQRELARLEELLARSSTEDLTTCLDVFHNARERLHELYHTRSPN